MSQVTKSLSTAEITAIQAQSAPATTSAPAVATFHDAAGRTKTITLQWPLEVDGKVIDKIELRRLIGRDFRALATMPAGTDENAFLIGMMSGLSPEIIDALDGDDFTAVNEAARDFLPQAMRVAAAQASQAGEAMPQ